MSLKNNLLYNFILLIFLYILSFSNKINAESISVWGEFHPPLNGSPDDKDPGYMIEILQYILEKNGHTLEYILGPRSRGARMVEAGEINCLVNAKRKSHHYLEFPDEPWGYHAATLFALPDSTFKYENIAQIKKMSLGVIAGERYDNGPLDLYIEEKSRNVLFLYGYAAMEQQVNTVLKKRVDLVVSCPLLMRGQLKSMEMPLEALKTVGEVKPFVGMYLACGKDQPRAKNIVELINKEIPIMRASGKLQSILDKYGQIDWAQLHQSLKEAYYLY